MMRTIVTPAVLPPAALAELKQWLGISTTQDDDSLSSLLAMALEVCADFTGMLPLLCTVEESLGLHGQRPQEPWSQAWPFAHPRWHRLTSTPVKSVAAVAGLQGDGTPIAVEDVEIRIDASGACQLRIDPPHGCTSALVTLEAGLAADWDHLPQPLHHGIIRLAAHQYRMRETAGADALPPASVTALWRPYRRMRVT
ncbi:head-tail connector protein [Novosphingobium terrae]|uniref:head-tail connector protein n=1 Tax=Novosphingobium terrae TaxID=2726189 RepID=UPI0019812133|nr:phage head-tail connector protein [Novosphingobium terrae]